MVVVLWLILDGMGVFASIDRTIVRDRGDADNSFDLMDYIALPPGALAGHRHRA